MTSLFIFREDHGRLDDARFVDLLQSMGEVSNIRENPDSRSRVEAVFYYQGGRTEVCMDSGLQFISMADRGPCVYELAWRIQRSTEVPLRMVNESNTYEVELRDFGTSGELEEEIESREA